MKILLSLFFTCICFYTKAQINSKPELTTNHIVLSYDKYRAILKNNVTPGGMPNAIAVVPQLTKKAYHTKDGFDIYILNDNMGCLTPDSNFRSNMPIVAK